MKRRIFRTIDVAALIMVAWMGAALVPANWFWFAPGNVVVSNSAQDIAPSVLFDRAIKRRTQIEYQVVIREMHKRRVVCDPENGPFTYRPDATLPDDMDLIWWTGGDDRCWPREPGTYIMETCWTVTRPFFGLVPPKTVCRESNPFSIIAGARAD